MKVIKEKREGLKPRGKDMQFIKATDKYCSLEEHVAAPIFRKTFELSDEVKVATLEIAVTGFYVLYVNGVDITKGLLAPYNQQHLLHYQQNHHFPQKSLMHPV